MVTHLISGRPLLEEPLGNVMDLRFEMKMVAPKLVMLGEVAKRLQISIIAQYLTLIPFVSSSPLLVDIVSFGFSYSDFSQNFKT